MTEVEITASRDPEGCWVVRVSDPRVDRPLICKVDDQRGWARVAEMAGDEVRVGHVVKFEPQWMGALEAKAFGTLAMLATLRRSGAEVRPERVLTKAEVLESMK